MRLSALLATLFRLLLVPALSATAYLYLYPAAQHCGFPSPPNNGVAPFRLLALGDPQLEGDTSLPATDATPFPHLQDAGERLWDGDVDGLKDALGKLVRDDLARWLQTQRKKLDLWGNDLYLAHIYRSVSWWTQPTHTVVLGDLLGSQWIGDEEFARRTERFWGTVFNAAEKVSGDVMDAEGRTEILGQDEKWARRVIAVAGNHDIGYAGDINERRIERFEEGFGRVNWDIRFRLDTNTIPSSSKSRAPDNATATNAADAPELHLLILNSMNLDSPAYDTTAQDKSLAFLADALPHPDQSKATILLTHIPLHKPAGLCVDGPFFSYFPPDQGGGIKEQNHLSEGVSREILQRLDQTRGRAVVLNGHDHEGCDVVHVREVRESGEWAAGPYAPSTPSGDGEGGIREITVRSMMGAFGGNAGLLSAWFDADSGGWEFAYEVCVLGVQHWWWAVHVVDLVVLGLGVGAGVVRVVEGVVGGRREEKRGKTKVGKC